MYITKLSTKGQIVIPKQIREALGVKSGTSFKVELKGGRIILEPVKKCVADEFYGKFKDVDLLGELSKEHRNEKEKGVRHER
ncbi:MAG TPA: AbrB/MazE/SpoVT family DNA-binding domain-containing protein [Desulfotomaculum sp.]|nr:AbrB/MazE/SpoVT family DNA-binding domain-containing protein [Desulfotomaculum sp.]